MPANSEDLSQQKVNANPPIACIHVPALALQILTQRNPHWRGKAVAVVDDNKAQGKILWINHRAQSSGIRVGMRYAQALSIERHLCADIVEPEKIKAQTQSIIQTLQCFSPEIETASHEPGVYWINTNGLSHLYPSLRAWGQSIRQTLQIQGWTSNISIGWSRFCTYIISKNRQGTHLSSNQQSEFSKAQRLPLYSLCLDYKNLEKLRKLSVETIGAFINIPSGQIRQRFNDSVYELHEFASKNLEIKIQPLPIQEPLRATVEIIPSVKSLNRLLFFSKSALDKLITLCRSRYQTIKSLEVTLHLDYTKPIRFQISPASPTVDNIQILQLIQLRLEKVKISEEIHGITLVAAGTHLETKQLHLFNQNPKRDIHAANRALARIRTEFGNTSVLYPVIKDAILPEAKVEWKPCQNIDLPQPHRKAAKLIRRVYYKPQPLHQVFRDPQDGWFIRGQTYGPVIDSIGPHILCGGWWQREVHRKYYYLQTHNQDWQWCFFDVKRKRWCIQGEV